jgi:sulfur-carrier protein adenylyltransferase/sulfurtransferase
MDDRRGGPAKPSLEDPFSGFGPEELERYARHLGLAEVGAEGQRRLRAARVLLVGAGGLGSPAALYLAAAGVGTLGIVDPDRVELSNLQRQLLHGTRDVDRPKTDSARDRLRDVNPHVDVRLHPVRLTSLNAAEILEGYDLVVDGSDNFPTRYLVNDACVLAGKPWVYGAVLRWEGQMALFGAPEGPCYRCLFREPPPPGLVPGCAEAGVVGVLPGIVGTLQALEALKWILGVGRSAAGRLLVFDALSLSFREVRPRRDPACPVCGDRPTVRELIDYERFCSTGEERTAGAEDEGGVRTVSPRELREALSGDGGPLLVDVREPWEWGAGSLEDRGAVHVPLGALEERLEELPRDREVVLYCRTGARSEHALLLLRAAGFHRVSHLEGGLRAWAVEVDPDLPVA